MTNGRIAYLSGAPRASTRPSAETGGPRAHMLGVIGGFKDLGWEVCEYIVGDKTPTTWSSNSSAGAISESNIRRLAADMLRLHYRFHHRRIALESISPNVDFVYERFAAFQAMGATFKESGVPWVLETNAPLFMEADKVRRTTTLPRILRALEVKAYRDCDLLICISEPLKQIVVSESGISPSKVLVLPNAVDTKRFDPNSYDAIRYFDGFTIGFVGTLHHWQRLDVLIDAVAVARAQSMDVSLVVVGDGAAREDWESKAADLRITQHVKFVGQVHWDKVPQHISGFDVAYSAPLDASVGSYLSPLKMYEYMAMRIPLLAAVTSDADHLTNHGESGFLFNPLTDGDLVRAIKEAYAAMPNLAAIGEASRKQVQESHSWVHRVRDLVTAVEGLL